MVILKATHTFSDFVKLGVYAMAKESSNASEGAASGSLLFFLIKIHLAATQNFDL